MFPKYYLFYVLNTQICWSYLVFHYDELHQVPQATPNFTGVGEPLILTPYIRSNQISKALKLSTVQPFLEGIESSSGYFTVDEKYNSNLFFWFFKSSKGWRKAPLLLWLQGGPGCSSMFGLFEETGPYIVTPRNKLKPRMYSWTKDYNVIYLDQPVGTGFSFTESPVGYIHTQEEVADHLYEALTQFFQLYPELEENPFYITGESYAGKYIPSISYKIHRLKMDGLSRPSINLKGLFMISSCMDGLVNGLSNFCFQVGIIDSQTKTKLEKMEENIEFYISFELWELASKLTDQLLSEIQMHSAVNLYDFTKPSTPTKENYVDFLETYKIRKEIHVGNTKFSNCSNKIYEDFETDIPQSVVPWVQELIEHYPIAFVGGQLDIAVAYPLVLNVMNNLNWSGAAEYSRAKRHLLVDKDLSVSYGYHKSAGNLKDILIRGAGHMVPKDQPRSTLDLLKKFINNEF